MHSESRRFFLSTSMAASAGAALSSCSSTIDLIGNQAPSVDHKLIVDAHCHVFNAEDIDTYSYVNQTWLHETWQQILFFPFIAFEKSVFRALKEIAPGMKRENWLLDGMIEEIRKDPAKYYTKDDRGANLLQPLLDLTKSIHPNHAKSAKSIIEDAGSRCRVKRTTEGPGFNPLRGAALRLAATLPGGFVDCMANYRIYNALHLMKRFPEVSVFVTATLDFDSWFPRWGGHDNVSEPLLEQVEVMQKISIITHGRVLYRTGFCPLRQVLWEKTVESNKKSTKPVEVSELSPYEVVRCSIEHYGSVGVKLYPVLGFRPARNCELTNSQFGPTAFERAKKVWPGLSEQGDELGKALDKALDDIYKLCQEPDKQVSVMAHTNHSWGYDNDTRDRTSPKYWAEVLRKHPKLKVDLGHFGGFDEGLDANAKEKDKSDGWPRQIVRDLFPHYPNVYADISDIKLDHAAKATEDLPKVFKTGNASERIMYGTDWHESLFPDGAHHYLERWAKLFENNKAINPVAPNFFGWNAVKFLGLDNGPLRSRLDRFFAEHLFDRVPPARTLPARPMFAIAAAPKPKKAPDWMAVVDSLKRTSPKRSRRE